MTAHVRTQIRDAVVAQVTGLASTGDRVYPGRQRPLGKDNGACLLVYAADELSERETIGQNPLLARAVSVVVEGRASGSASAALEDALNQIAAEVEPVMAAAAPRLGGLASDVQLTATRLAVSAAAESHVGSVRLTYRIVYRTRAATPTAVA